MPPQMKYRHVQNMTCAEPLYEYSRLWDSGDLRMLR